MDFKTLLYRVDGNVGIITFNRPNVLNAIDDDVLDEFNLLLDQIEPDKNVRCLVITGEGKAFSAGGDIAHELKQDMRGAYNFSRHGAEAMARMESFRCPVIGAINGYALGGGLEFALACDLRFAAEGVKLGMPEISLAVFPGWGGTQRLPRLIGVSRAKRLIYSGSPVTADEALELGIVDFVVPAEDLMSETIAFAQKIAKNAPLAMQRVKQAINEGIQTDLDKGLKIESALFSTLYGTEDQHEAMTAFLEKRPPAEFKGR